MTGGQGISVFPSVDAIQEFKVLGATFPAEFGRSLGSVINVAYKAGTNTFHGSGYEFVRDSAFDSKNYFQKLRGETHGDFSRHQFGGSAGGPLQIGKMFYMASFEGLREKAFASTTLTVPTALERQDFLPDARGQRPGSPHIQPFATAVQSGRRSPRSMPARSGRLDGPGGVEHFNY